MGLYPRRLIGRIFHSASSVKWDFRLGDCARLVRRAAFMGYYGANVRNLNEYMGRSWGTCAGADSPRLEDFSCNAAYHYLLCENGRHRWERAGDRNAEQ